mmetsp:Transcript_48194/g.155427  ORF Transcript_48194/g.155427 Transcript_48194/m.155427 type:complete len:192 (-) Transcript_48194:92-667(-)
MATNRFRQRLRLHQRSQASPTSLPRSLLTHMSACLLQSGFCRGFRHHHLRRSLHSRRRRHPSLLQRPTCCWHPSSSNPELLVAQEARFRHGKLSPAKPDAPAKPHTIGIQQPPVSRVGVFLWFWQQHAAREVKRLEEVLVAALGLTVARYCELCQRSTSLVPFFPGEMLGACPPTTSTTGADFINQTGHPF